ncbi:MAG: protein kinase [Proteobacteria bacterium]|nr:protein kinase [Pseudomonadota bacterium]
MSTTNDPSPDHQVEDDFVALKPGQTIGRYEVISILGQGGFGITYRARDGQLGREVAIKEYLPSALAIRQGDTTVRPRNTRMSDDFTWGRERFVSEGQTLATLHRVPAIVHVFDFLEANGTAYIVMELLSGETLEDRLRRDRTLGPADVDKVLWPLLDGLEQVHAAGFLHRDIKPANILLDDAGRPTLIDFGASRAAMAGRTTALTAIFTPGYAAAEQMTSAKQGPWTDIYGLSATLYHAITGQAPPSAFDRLLSDAYTPLAKLAPAGFAPGLCAGIDAGLAVVASDRPQTIAGWRPLLGMTQAPAGDATVVMPAAKPSGAHRPVIAPSAAAAAPKAGSRVGLWIAAAGLLIALLGGGGYYAYSTRGPDPEMVKARALAEEEAAKRQKAEEEMAALRAADEKRRKDEQAAAELKRQAAELKRQEELAAARQREIEEEARRKYEAELAEQKRQDEEARRKQAEELEARRKAIEFVQGDFEHFGRTLLLIGLAGRSDEIRLQGVDIVNDPALRQLAVNALASEPRHLRCRQTDRLTDGTPLYRCLITPIGAKAPLDQVPDNERTDLALALVRNGLVLASCDAPRSYADAEDEARGRQQSLWSRVKIQEYKRRCTR